MEVLFFDKNSLGNLEYSLQREMLATNRSGGYMSTTIVCCNTRKYHGLMVVPAQGGGGVNNVLLSSLDEVVEQQGQEFNLAIHRFPGTYSPKGHKYMADFSYTPTPTMTYRIGAMELRKEMLWIHSCAQLMIRYTLLNALVPVRLKLRPFLAFRDSHALTSANMYADGHAYSIDMGVRCRLYEGFPWLNMRIGKEDAEFVRAPDWYYGFEYPEEQQRGYPFREDLLTPGYFEFGIDKGESVVFGCSLEGECMPADLNVRFAEELAKRSDKNDFYSCLRHSARQFIARRDGQTEIIAGYPWFGSWGRDTFIALPGITLTQGDTESCRKALDTMVERLDGGLFPNTGSAYNSADAPLWFFRTLQQLGKHVGDKEIWDSYGKAMKRILKAYRDGMEYIEVHESGLVWASHPSVALTWMDAVVDGKPVTGRDGYQVEINALWYNAVCYTLALARQFGDARFVNKWKDFPELIRTSFLDLFWLEEEGYLADYVDQTGPNRDIRPNQVIACALAYVMPDKEMTDRVLATVKQHLLTPKGLRTLSPDSLMYEGRYCGGQSERDRQYHQGTVWPWLLEYYAAACFGLHGAAFAERAEQLIAGFHEDINSYGIGSIAEIYDGDPPHHQRGAISQAWSVGAILRIREMIDAYAAAGKDKDS